jgi:LacI family transcriptional regulator
VVTVGDPRAAGDAGVRVDQAVGLRLAVEHLVGQGHSELAYVAGPVGHLDADARLAAFFQITAELGLRVPPDRIRRADFTIEAGVAATASLLAHRPSADPFTALLAADDYVAAGAIQAAYAHGLRVPLDLSIIGFDDVDVARATTPPLTTIRVPLAELGALAASTAAGLARGERPIAPPPPRPSLVVRDSVAPLH